MQQLRQTQVRGINGGTLEDDINNLGSKTKTYDPPVATKSDLPLVGNDNGDVRVVIDENKVYIWNEKSQQWLGSNDTYTETTTLMIRISADDQKEIETGIRVGAIGGMLTTSCIQLFVNGMIQKPDIDYVVKIDNVFNAMIEWTSRDFPLEISDTITMSYDKLLLS